MSSIASPPSVKRLFQCSHTPEPEVLALECLHHHSVVLLCYMCLCTVPFTALAHLKEKKIEIYWHCCLLNWLPWRLDKAPQGKING